MAPRASKLTEALIRKRDDATVAWRFFRQWLKAPLTTAAVSPSSQELAAEMLRELPAAPRRVVELGGGTGVFTEALLRRGIPPQHLLVFELNETLHEHLQQRFPETIIVCEDARNIVRVLHDHQFAEPGGVDGIISGLGLLSMNAELQGEILAPAFEALAPDGRFIQFTYGPTNPVKTSVMRKLGLHARRAGFTLRNLPPASVYVLTRSVSKGIKPVQVRR
jgi:phosphatidylethanolamine/phosphatidyl-N-methylethanolamine N-methyltransferase